MISTFHTSHVTPARAANAAELPLKERRGKFGGPKKKATFIAHEAVEFLIAQGVCHDEASGCMCTPHPSLHSHPPFVTQACTHPS
jgi:hypothetical protein